MTLSFDLEAASREAVPVAGARAFRRDHPYQDGLKRIVDVALVLCTLPVSLTLIALCAISLLLTGTRPFFVQHRIGRHGREFAMVKLRTMCSDPEAALVQHLADNPEAEREWRRHQKLRHDPRITRIGRFLRRSSLDELPQLWNVLRGDMALVGPRPMMVCQKGLYRGHAYFRMRPGLTGPWQISERSKSPFAMRSSFDSAYDLRQGLLEDLRIILRTFVVVWRQTGC